MKWRSSIWRLENTLRRYALPFFSLALSADGQKLYATCPLFKSIVVIDTATNREVAVLNGIGVQPVIVAVVP